MAPTPRRDVMGDFAKWYVGGDGGLMEDFTVYMVDEILKKTYDGFVEDMEEQARREEEERVNKEVETFRVYNLQVKFFYRWKRNARAKRLRELRRSGREQWRAYHMAKREEEKEAARQAEEERIRNAKVDRTKEMTAEMMRRKKEERAAAKAAASASSSAAVKRPGHTRQYSSTSTKMATSRPSSATLMPPPASTVASSARTRKLSGKSQAIRDALLNPKKPEGFRRSLGSMSMSSRSSASPEPRTSNVSERWRLKAMGIVQMPDGTALPENMANEILYGGKSYPGLSWSQNQGHGSRRRATSYTNVGAEAPTSDPSRSMQASTSTAVRRPTLLSHSFGLSRSEDDHDHEMGMSPPPLPAPTTNKRKRHGQGEEDGENGGSIEDGDSILDAGGASPPKRPMSESQRLIGELRAMREELEEGAAWYRSQAERLGSTANSRASTPWGESI